MTEKEKHLITFQNICVMAHADGMINEEEIRLLAEMARGMGLAQEEFGEKIQQISDLDFIIPDDEAEREHELRMVVLTMITDGKIDPREYRSLLKFASLMGIPREYVDQVVEFYVLKQEERLANLGIFQNLYLVAAADGKIDEKEEALLMKAAESLNLMPSDFEYVKENLSRLDLVIPEDDEERRISLRNLVFMMMIDGHIDDEEYALCAKFARKIGLGEERVRLIMDEYEKEMAHHAADQETLIENNIDAILDIFNALKALSIPVSSQVSLIRYILNTRNFKQRNFKEDPKDKALYDLMWLAFVHVISSNQEMMVLLPLHLDLAAKNENWRELQSLLIESERKHGTVLINIVDRSLEEVQEELKEFYKKLAI